VNPVSAASVVKGETVGAIGGGGRWKSTDSRTETRPVVPWTGLIWSLFGHRIRPHMPKRERRFLEHLCAAVGHQLWQSYRRDNLDTKFVACVY
jgi:hypothetical protein